MERRIISKAQFDFLKTELHSLENQGHFDDAEKLLVHYEVKKEADFIRIVLALGAILLGVGILSFIAGNWDAMSSTLKICILLISLITFYTFGAISEKSYPKTSRSLYYIGICIYGASIFLIGQIFHLGGNYHNTFFIWMLGIIPLMLFLRDFWIALFTVFLMCMYSSELLIPSSMYPYFLILYLPFMYVTNERIFKKSPVLFSFILLLTCYLVGGSAVWFELGKNEVYAILITFFFGTLLTYIKHKDYHKPLLWIGSLFQGVAALLLTFPRYFEQLLSINDGTIISLGFAVIFVLYSFYRIQHGNLPSLIIICAFIFRFYTDFTYDFLPKSLFFIIGGLLLIIFGFWFERKRKGVVE